MSIRDFVVEVDGAPAAAIYQPAAPLQTNLKPAEYRIAGWHTFSVSFAAGQMRLVRHTYFAVPSYSANRASRFQYILRTGPSGDGLSVGLISARNPSGGFTIAYLSPGIGSQDYVAVEQGAMVWHVRGVEPAPQDDIWIETATPGDRPMTRGLSRFGQLPQSAHALAEKRMPRVGSVRPAVWPDTPNMAHPLSKHQGGIWAWHSPLRPCWQRHADSEGDDRSEGHDRCPLLSLGPVFRTTEPAAY